jgi:class 3 adenylate cyclase/pimeloyl-ACP methyl ester carboxylesterase
MDVPVIRYARSGELDIAYQVVGDGPLDVVFIPIFASNIEILWEHPGIARFLRGLSSFSRLIAFDRRGTGMSDGNPETTLDDQIDDVLAVLDAVGAEQPAFVSLLEGAALAALFAASHPDKTQALAMMSPWARMVYAPDYDWALTPEQREMATVAILASWGDETDANPWVAQSGEDLASRRAMARLQRQSMTPRAAARAQAAVGQVDIRHVLPSIQCPTLILRREGDMFIHPRHSEYVAENIPNAQYRELPGAGAPWTGDVDDSVAEIEQFLTGTRRPVVSDRVLATVLFTDIVGSTQRAAQLGDGSWRTLLERHDAIVRAEVERNRGRFVKSLGDGALAMFDGPSRAISAATAARDAVRALDLEIRCGLHTGECELLDDDDIGGIAVHIGARVGALAGAGEVLVSSTVRDLVVGSGQTLADRGEHELKGVPGPWRLFAVET